MKFLVSALFLFCCGRVWAQEAPSPVKFILAAGSEIRPEENVNGDIEMINLQNYAFGVGFKKFLFIFERATYEKISRDSILTVDRKLEDHMLWLQWRAMKWNFLVPFLTGGVGAYKETVTTQLSGFHRTSESPQKLLTGIGFGTSLDVRLLWLSLEARVLMGDELSPQPTVGGLLRAGVWF